MKPEEVIRSIDLIREMDVNTPITQVDIANVEWAKEMAIEALEKQVPKPIKYATRCPACDEIWYGDGDGYCNNCGQKLEDASYRKEVKECHGQ